MAGRNPEPIDPRYVEARRVLMDALFALAAHTSAIVIVGAQAVYLRTGDAVISAAPHTLDVDLAIPVAPYTTDGDLAVDPIGLKSEPAIAAAMVAAGFSLSRIGGHVEPGIWVAEATANDKTFQVPVDLIVPEGFASPRGRRGARLGPHGNQAARRAVGLEAALVDRSPMTVTTLDRSDQRTIEVAVAGPAALLVAKAHKLHDRQTDGRLSDKDAADVFRIMQTTDPVTVRQTLASLSVHDVAGPPTQAALRYLDELFSRLGRPGVQMAERALAVGVAKELVQAVCVAYTRVLLAESP